jgi:hypothetical protein
MIAGSKMILLLYGCRIKIAVLGLLLFAAGSILSAAEPVKLAIIAKPGKHRYNIDMLTEKFSKQPHCTLLERNDIDYIIKEHKLTALAIVKNGIRIGQLIGADGVIIVSTVKVNDKNYIYLRLASVKSGVIIGTATYQLDQQSRELDFADAAVRHFSTLLSKLSLNRDELVNISILNFRSSSPAVRITGLERTIPKLLTLKLSMNKKTIVNERWNSWQLAFEKELAHDSSAFKTGNILIDGEIKSRSRESEDTGSNNGFIEITLRINRQTEKDLKTIKVSGETRQLPALIEKIAEKIQLYLKNSSKTTPWDIKAESQRFYKDAKWAYDFGKFKQAEDAIEAALTLGLDSFESAVLHARILGARPFMISDLDYNNYHYTVPFQYEGRKVENPGEHLLDTCRALDVLAELHKRLAVAAYYDKWKTKNNFRELDKVERNFLIYCPRLIMWAYMDGLHKNPAFSDVMTMLQLKTRRLFKNIISRRNWEGRNGDNYKYQAYMVFFATGICWYKNMHEWLAQFKRMLTDNVKGRGFYLVRRGICEGRNRFERCGKQWPFQLKCFETEYYGTATKELFSQWDNYISQLESSGKSRERFDGLVLRDYSFCERNRRGLKIFTYIVENAKTVKPGTSEYERVLIAIKMIEDHDFSNMLHPEEYLRPRIVNFSTELITSMDKPPWEIIVKLCGIVRLNEEETKTLKIAVDLYKKKFKIKSLNSVCKFKDFCRRYDKLITPKKKAPQYLAVKPLEIPVWLDTTDTKLKSYGPHRSHEQIYKFKEYGDKLLYIVKKGWSKPFQRWQNQYVINIIDAKDGQCDVVIMPKEIAGKKFFPEWKKYGDAESVRNVLLSSVPERSIIYINRFGDIFAYDRTSEKWYLYDSLGLDKVVKAEISDNTLYIAFGMPYNDLDFNRVPTGLIAYDIAAKKYRVLFNNQCLEPRYEIEKQRRLRIQKLAPVDNGLYFITNNPQRLRSLCFYDKATSDIKTLFTKKSTLHLSGDSQKNMFLSYIWENFFQDFKNFTLAINCARFYYRRQASVPLSKWQWNNYIYYMRTLIDFIEPITFKHNNGLIILGNRNKIYNSLTVHYWKPGKFKNKVIPISLEGYSDIKSRDGIRLDAVICKNSLFLLGKRGEFETFIWKLDFKELDDYFDKKLDYPYIFPYGFSYRPYEKRISFWLRQRITMETIGDGSELRYTTDGSWPNETSRLYTEPFVIDRSTTIIARNFRKGSIPSDPFIVSYRKVRPVSYIVDDFDGDGKDELMANVGYLLKTPENALGISKTVLYPKGNGDFFIFKNKNMKRKNIGYRKYNSVYWGMGKVGEKYKKINYPASSRKSIFLAGDFNGDGNTDTAFIQNNILQMDIDRDGKFDREINYGSGFKADQWLAGDWNGDGKDDIIFRTGTKFSIDIGADGKADEFYSAENAAANAAFVISRRKGDDAPDIATLKDGRLIPVKLTVLKASKN